MDAGALHKAIAEVCPITGVSVPKEDDRATWSYDPTPAATQAEKDAANNVMATIPIDTPLPPPQGAPVLYDHENRIRDLEGAAKLSLAEFQAKTGGV